MRVVQVCSGNVRHHAVSEGITGEDGTLGEERNSVHVRRGALVDTVPVDRHGVSAHAVLNLDLQGVTLAGLDHNTSFFQPLLSTNILVFRLQKYIISLYSDIIITV